MKTITFSGSSDDLVAISGAPGSDEIDSERVDGEWNVLKWQQTGARNYWSGAWEIVSGSERLRVDAFYFGCWSFAPGLAAEDDPLPPWPIRIYPSENNQYSVELSVEVPDDAIIRSV